MKYTQPMETPICICIPSIPLPLFPAGSATVPLEPLGGTGRGSVCRCHPQPLGPLGHRNNHGWLALWNQGIYDFPFSWEFHHTHWRTHSFQGQVYHQPDGNPEKPLDKVYFTYQSLGNPIVGSLSCNYQNADFTRPMGEWTVRNSDFTDDG